jgi:hypothetical protein
MQQTNNKTFAFWLGIVIAGSLVISSGIAAYTFYRVRNAENTLSVTGSATVNVTSDKVRWTGSFTRTVKISGLKAGYDQMTKDLAVVEDFLKTNGITDDAVTITPISMNQDYSNVNQNVGASERDYVLTQSIELNSTDVAKITTLAKHTEDIIGKGVVFSSNPVEYYYSKLPDERVALLSGALADAKARAEKLAEGTGSRVGALKSAASGVVQVLPPNSVDVSDYGSYDTSSIEKTIMVTVKASFNLY